MQIVKLVSYTLFLSHFPLPSIRSIRYKTQNRYYYRELSQYIVAVNILISNMVTF